MEGLTTTSKPLRNTGAAFNKLAKIWRSGQLSKSTKIRIFNTNVIAVLLCGE